MWVTEPRPSGKAITKAIFLALWYCFLSTHYGNPLEKHTLLIFIVTKKQWNSFLLIFSHDLVSLDASPRNYYTLLNRYNVSHLFILIMWKMIALNSISLFGHRIVVRLSMSSISIRHSSCKK